MGVWLQAKLHRPRDPPLSPLPERHKHRRPLLRRLDVPPPRHHVQQRVALARRDEDEFAGEALLEAGEVARGEVLEDVVAAVLAQRRDEKRLHAFESEFVEVVVWNYFQRENTVDEGGRRREREGRKRGTQLG